MLLQGSDQLLALSLGEASCLKLLSLDVHDFFVEMGELQYRDVKQKHRSQAYETYDRLFRGEHHVLHLRRVELGRVRLSFTNDFQELH